MKTPNKIPHPQFTSARKLKPLEINNIRCARQHTVLTPEVLNRIATSQKDSETTSVG